MLLRQHYWAPRNNKSCFVDDKKIIFAFNRHQRAGTWSDKHLHENWGELVYVCTGSIVLCTDKGNFLGQGTRAVWVPPGLWHEWYMPEASWNRTLFVHTSIFADAERFFRCHSIAVTPLVRELIFAMGDIKPDFTTEEGRRLGLVLMDGLKASKADESSLIMPQEHRLVELCSHLLANPDQKMSLADCSKALGLCEKTLSRLFYKQTGMTFGRWLAQMRLSQARSDIEHGVPVTTVSLNCGYSSVSAFINAFKKQFGVTPGSLSKCREKHEQ